MLQPKRSLGFADDSVIDGLSAAEPVSVAAAAMAVIGDAATAAVMAVQTIVPGIPAGITEAQLNSYTYGKTTIYGSNFVAAWRYSSGAGIAVSLVDDGFDPTTTATYGNFSTSLSRAFGGTSSTAIGEPTGGYHGTTTSGLIGATAANGSPEGLAPNAVIVGVKVTFSTATIAILAQAEQYAASVSSVVNNSWGFSGYGAGQPTDPTYAIWYSAVQWAVANGRGGLGDIIVFAAGNDRTNADNLAVQPIQADYRVIAVAASDANGTVAYYSNPGAALLIAAVADNVAVVNTGGSGYALESGTSYAAPTVSAIVAMMLSVNPALGWRDVQEILADAAYMPPPSAASFTYNGDTTWNGGGMHFSNDLGFGVVDANVAVNLARAWTEQSTSANLDSVTVSHTASFKIGENATATSTLTSTANVRVQHVQISLTDTYLPVAWSKVVLVSPDGTQSVLLDQVGLVNGADATGGLDVSGSILTSNAFWGESAIGTWTLEVQDISGVTIGTITGWSLTFIGDNAATVQTPLVYTPEFASIANHAREVVTPGASTTIDLIALPRTTTINLNGGSGTIDGVGVTVGTGLKNANAEGSKGSVTLTGLGQGGSELTGGDGTSTLNGYGGDTITAGFGTTTIGTGTGSSTVTLSSSGASTVTIASGGGDTIYAGIATATVIASGNKSDTIYDQSARLTFINGNAASLVQEGSGTVTIQGGAGGGTYYGGTGGGSQLIAGSGLVTFYGEAAGDTLTAAGSGADKLIAGSGPETLSGGTATGSITLQAGSGLDTMIAGKGKTTFVLGTGNSSITDGGTSDIIEFQFDQAGGLDTILGFRLQTDDIHLIGFGPLGISNAINTQKSDGQGGTMLTFIDNTRIDLLGISKVTTSTFA